MSRRSASWLWLLLLILPLRAQAPTLTAPPSLIDELVANAVAYRANVPSITADEVIDSQESFLGILPDKVHATSTMRVLRAGQGQNDRATESRQLLTLNGKPVDATKKPHLPFTLFGGFGSFQEMVFTPSHRGCFQFHMLQQPAPDGSLQIAITPQPADAWPPQCPVLWQQVTGLVHVDPETHQLRHFERTVKPPAGQLAPFASVDCAPARIGDETFWLPVTVIGRNDDGKLRGEFIAHYSNYHRYTASITLLPGATEVDAPAAVSTPH